MHPKVYNKIENILMNNKITGAVLEVGALPNSSTLLVSNMLKNAEEKIGINLGFEGNYKDAKFFKGNSNKMEIFKNDYFDCVISNAMLEHDLFFWKSISEFKRILKPGGLLIIGTPSYKNYRINNFTSFFKGWNFLSDFLSNSTFCFKIHYGPGDYYRFSEQTFRELFFEGFKNVNIESFMIPSRTIGYGFK